MISGSTHRLSLGILILVVIACVATLLGWDTRTRKERELSANDPVAKGRADLDGLRQNYGRIRSVHLAATATISIYQEKKQEGTGSFEYWADGDRYRTSCHTDPQLELLADIDMAYDGGQFHYLDRHMGLLSHRTQDEAKSFAALPNPFFLPVDYLSNDSDDCVFCKLRLKDFKSMDPQWEQRKEKVSVHANGKDPDTQLDFSEMELPGFMDGRKLSKVLVRLNRKADGKNQVTRIDRVQDDGKPLASVGLSDFSATSLGEFPRTIKIEVFDDQGTVIMKVDYKIQTVEIDPVLDSRIFTISDDEANGVWDSDQKKFVKLMPPKKKP